MTQKFFKLLLLISCIIPVLASGMDFADVGDMDEAAPGHRKPFTSLQVAGPLAVTGLASLNALNVKKGADFGADVGVDGNLYVDGNITLDSCLVLTCTSAGQLLVNNIALSSATGGAVLGQYAYVENIFPQSLSDATFLTFDNGDGAVSTAGLAIAENGITFSVPGIYDMEYSVLVEVPGDPVITTTVQTFEFELVYENNAADTFAIPGSYYGQSIVPNFTANISEEAQIYGQVITNVTPAQIAAGYRLGLYCVYAGHDDVGVLPNQGVVNASIKVIKIG